MWLVRFLHVIPPYNVIRTPVDICKTVIGTRRLEWFHFTFVGGGRREASKGHVGKVQGAGIWSGPWGRRRVFLGWEDGKAIAGIGSSMGKSRRCGNESSHWWRAQWVWGAQCNAVGTVGDGADTGTRSQVQNANPPPEPGEPCHLHMYTWISRSIFKLHLWLPIGFVSLLWFKGL